MSQINVQRTINAPLETVFKTVADIRQFSEAIDHITNVEFLTEQQVGLGTRFRETRLMKGKQHSTTLEVTEYVENERIRMVADEGGTVWDTVFTVRRDDESTLLDMTMDARPHKLLAKIVTPFIKGMVAKFVKQDMDAVKRHCERTST